MNLCLRCAKPLPNHKPYDTHCSNRCWRAHINHGPGTETDRRIRQHEREGRAYWKAYRENGGPPVEPERPPHVEDWSRAADDLLRAPLVKNLLRYAVGQAMFCRCGSILDVDRAVMLEIGDHASIQCADCHDSMVSRLVRKNGEAWWAGALCSGAAKVTDGRDYVDVPTID